MRSQRAPPRSSPGPGCCLCCLPCCLWLIQQQLCHAHTQPGLLSCILVLFWSRVPGRPWRRECWHCDGQCARFALKLA